MHKLSHERLSKHNNMLISHKNNIQNNKYSKQPVHLKDQILLINKEQNMIGK